MEWGASAAHVSRRAEDINASGRKKFKTRSLCCGVAKEGRVTHASGGMNFGSIETGWWRQQRCMRLYVRRRRVG